MTEVIARDILARARARGATVTTAESCTGGMVSAAITDIAGSSDIFHRGYVVYSNAAKQELLGVHAETLSVHGAVSEEVVQEMAEGARRAAEADLAVAISGVAGPGGSEMKPEGRVCFGLAGATETITETVDFGALGRANVRAAATHHALELLQQALSDE
ncbi:MAG: CinA family protein [Rhodobacteraceae bacterium]|uniref:Nicotinamide-nucleotide amidase n=1 Tax=Salipiger profundus TaxID=1229727 RepID=A0A1U7D8C3_9RHOB|nr:MULTISPECIES: CinA family protein [Salipiger]APX24315.1 nicotinamide-nucleotide amidase [Salipiger profundus]MAB06679.1 CinA family protein [Paracoccaceae bacterium]GFZ95937.1 competence damage-inducible protein A [Salipiger profundus]SFB84147.1 nicotinamide-nucleotide amidase [Salipiger profundus]